MTSPLTTRPHYGEGRFRTPQAEAKLPEGSPAGKGVSLDPNIPGYSTFNKPVDDNSTGDKRDKDESIYRVDGPRDLPKSQGHRDEIDHSDAKPSYMGLGEPHNSPITRYPYKDGKPNTHNASVEYVVGLWLSQTAPETTVYASKPTKVAAASTKMTDGLNPRTIDKSKRCAVVMKRVDTNNLRWIFAVDCGNGAKVVRVKADRQGNAVQFSKLDLHVACSCPAWRWQGPEFHSTTKDYQDPKTPLQGSASTPDIRDPNRVNKVCKHVAAVIAFTREWTVPNPKKK